MAEPQQLIPDKLSVELAATLQRWSSRFQEALTYATKPTEQVFADFSITMLESQVKFCEAMILLDPADEAWMKCKLNAERLIQQLRPH